MKIDQGSIWWVHPTPKIGSEQKGRRPALIIQNDIANKYLKTTIIVMISNSGVKGRPEMLQLGKEEGLKSDSYADFAQIFTIDKKRLIKKVGNIKVEQWFSVQKALATIFLKTIE